MALRSGRFNPDAYPEEFGERFFLLFNRASLLFEFAKSLLM